MKPTNTKKAHKPKPRGFAAMDPKRTREIASMGGSAVMKRRGHAKNIGRIGGMKTQARIRSLLAASKKGNGQ